MLAFSPAAGGPLADCSPNERAATLLPPALILRPDTEASIESVADQLALFAEHGHQTYVAEGGVHGSSMLDASRTSADPAQTWTTVLTFIEAALAR